MFLYSFKLLKCHALGQKLKIKMNKDKLSRAWLIILESWRLLVPSNAFDQIITCKSSRKSSFYHTIIMIVNLLLGYFFFQKSRPQFSCLKLTYERPVIGNLQDLCRKQEFLYHLAFDNEIGKALISIVKTVFDIRCIDMTSTSFMSHPNKIVH